MARTQRAVHQRQANMAKINATIANAAVPIQPTGKPGKAGPVIPNVAPGQPMTDQQKAGFRVLYQGGDSIDAYVSRMNPRQRAIYDAQVHLIGQDEADREYLPIATKFFENEQRSIAEKAARDAAQSVGDFAGTVKDSVHGADVSIGRLPTPGSIAFPLILLSLFFFILIQVKGNSRIGWLWLVLSNNAYTGGSSAVGSNIQTITNSSGQTVGASGNFGPAGGGGRPQTPPASQQTLIQPLSSIMPAIGHSANGLYGTNPY